MQRCTSLYIADSKWNTNKHLITLINNTHGVLIQCWRLFTDYRGRMDVWFKTLLIFVVLNKVHLYRKLVNTTCLQLAKLSKQQFRLSCNETGAYHCLLNGNSTYEYEICKTWKWIPGGTLFKFLDYKLIFLKNNAGLLKGHGHDLNYVFIFNG